jgi:hypothetical protein
VRVIVNASSVAVLRARLPFVDRRALSEAWFSALHLAKGESHLPSHRRATMQKASSEYAPAPPASIRRSGASQQPARISKTLRPISASVDRAFTSRERTYRAAPIPSRPASYAPFRASFQLAINGGRVQILVRRQGAILHVVALCSERHLDLVRRALACADLHLRAKGERVESSVRPFEVARSVR